MKNATTTVNPFDEIVGQSATKRTLDFYTNVFKSGGVVPTQTFIAPKGCGKTMLAEAFGKRLFLESGEVKHCHVLNCSAIKNLEQFISQFAIEHLVDRECTVVFDECSELPKKLTMALLTMLAPNKRNKNSFSYEDYQIDIDFTKHTFVFATSEPHKVFHALMDRTKRVELEEYSVDDIGEIMLMQDVDIDAKILEKTALTCRGNARSAVQRAKDMLSLLKTTGENMFKQSHWDQLKDIFNIKPLGMSNSEMKVLRVLNERPDGTSLTRLAACTGYTKEALQRDIEMYPMSHGLLAIETSGRVITPKGINYLKSLEAGA
jgi:Holliday junction resolvasome RuvABC ATP-dependent DNA helicase subunit